MITIAAGIFTFTLAALWGAAACGVAHAIIEPGERR
jgi:hypothetical protein